jgi:hypothetical protein
MYINLRKANALQEAILEDMPKIAATATISMHDENCGETIQTAVDALTDSLEKREALLDAYYAIRDAVAEANIRGGITPLVSRRARIEKDVAMYTSLISGTRDSINIIQAKLNRMVENTTGYGSEELGVYVSSVSDVDYFKGAISALKREKVSIQDQLLEKNITVNITLSENTIATLQSHGLLV